MKLWKEYELLDSGDGRKLERFGPYVLDRSEPQAIWKPLLAPTAWKSADAVYTHRTGRGTWLRNSDIPDQWPVSFRELVFSVRLSPSKHTGLFPEQAANWLEIQGLVRDRTKNGDAPRILNLFAYTGGATLAGASAGAEVCHVDSSKPALRWARQNMEASGLGSAHVRWMNEDAALFVERELRRGNRYDAIVMDPPPYGRGVKGRDWKLERDLAAFVESCARLLSGQPLFFLLNCYATGYSHLTLRNLLTDALAEQPLRIHSGDLFLEHLHHTRVLPCGLFALASAG